MKFRSVGKDLACHPCTAMGKIVQQRQEIRASQERGKCLGIHGGVTKHAHLENPSGMSPECPGARIPWKGAFTLGHEPGLPEV